ncbi:MAG: carboxypeptidase regulatory-like domain-containing protein [Nitrospirae bacterium]|nr:carboxypeptidase regulatory-like domain-containing protein [Nitrospirota bacterium]
MNKKIVLGVIALFVAFVLTMAYIANLNGPWRGQVIDAETKRPIEGAAVVAVWNKEFASPAGPGAYFLDADEAVTDKDGKFNIPARRYLSIPLFRYVKGPYFTIYKPGYGSFPSHQISPTYISDNIFGPENTVVELPKAVAYQDRFQTMIDVDMLSNIPSDKIPIINRMEKEETNWLKNNK